MAPRNGSSTKVEIRKARRKEERRARKQPRRKREHAPRNDHHVDPDEKQLRSSCQQAAAKQKKMEVLAAAKMMNKKKQHRGLKVTKKEGDGAAATTHYAQLDPDVAAALRRDDEEIALLEANLGTGKKDRSRLNREYAKLECYGDDFGDFLDELDTMVQSIVAAGTNNNNNNDDTETGQPMTTGRQLDSEDDGDDNASSDSDSGDEAVPMKQPAFDDLDEDDSVLNDMDDSSEGSSDSEDEDGVLEEDNQPRADDDNNDAESPKTSDSESTDDASESSDESGEVDHDPRDTYRPARGEDIYGKSLEFGNSDVHAKAYVPPHMRKKDKKLTSHTDHDDDHDHDVARQESLRVIQRSLNSALNRLSEDAVVPVAQSVVRLYSQHPTAHVNEGIWNNMQTACVSATYRMMGLIPVYLAALTGVHVQNGESTQLGEYLTEQSVNELWKELNLVRESQARTTRDASSAESYGDDDDQDPASKKACNLVLILCYLYNYGIVHCSLLYDLVRAFIESFAEVDVELLLLILSHCGRALRSDDPSALKEIVLLVQQTAMEKDVGKDSLSRVEYMVSAMMDLKNNKRRKQDEAHAEKTAKLRKAIGQIKSAASKNSPRTFQSSRRISLQDILQADARGRWWKTGASWTGNQSQLDGKKEDVGDETTVGGGENPDDSSSNKRLLLLAAKYRMNTDVRRSVFCIIMGSADYEDCFEKLVRAGMLKNRTERDTVRVLMECCGNEKSYNKFYSFLASRICEFQPQSKFTFQLAFWDIFKQFDELSARKAANLAKLLFHLVAVNPSLKLNVLKAIDMASIDELPESGVIFLTIFMSSILEYYDDPSDVSQLFDSACSHRKQPTNTEEDVIGNVDDGEALKSNITVFLVQVLKSSPRNKKGSKFRANLKAAIKACDTDNFF
jgi:nucleolar MIF4G domain-containing protein 1